MSSIPKFLKKHFFSFVFFLIFPLIVTYPLILKIKTGIYGFFYNTDLRGALWTFWWDKYAMTHHLDYHHCPFINAPFGFDFSLEPFSWILRIVFKVLLFFGPAGCLNLLLLIGFFMTGILTYFLVFFLTKNRTASLVSGFIFTFSPYHLNKAMEFGFGFLSNWVVLYVLAFLMLKEKRSLIRIFLATVAFGLILAFNIYSAFFLFLFMIGFLFFSGLYQWKIKLSLLRQEGLRSKEIRRRIGDGLDFIKNIFYVFVGAALINLPSFITYFKLEKLNPEEKASFGCVRSFDYLFSQSARPLSYLLPASSHPLFGKFTKQMFKTILYGKGPIEQTLYLGVIPLLLSFVAFKHWRRERMKNPLYINKRENVYIGFFIFSAFFAFICSMPPYFDLLLFKIYFPSSFFYKFFPMFRAYARMGFIAMLCVSVLAGYGIKFILENIRKKSLKIAFVVLIFSGVIFEFTNVPPLRVTDLGNISPIYQWLAEQPGDFIIAEYPMVKGIAGEAQMNYDYLYHQTKHKKRMVNGALVGTRAYKIKERILKINAPQTSRILKSLGVKYVIAHMDLYKTTKYKESVDVVGEMPRIDEACGYKLIDVFGNDFVYEVIAEPFDLQLILEDK